MTKLIAILLILGSLMLTSCANKRALTKKEYARELSEKFGFEISSKDHLELYAESAKWLGVPYKMGGNTKEGVDCSGLICHIYKQVYNLLLERTVEGIYRKNCRRTSPYKLKAGDLIFFKTKEGKSRKRVNHIGIILKDHLFIHSSVTKGVMVSSLKERYYQERVVRGGKVKR